MTVYKAKIKGAFVDDFSGRAVVASVYSKAVNLLLPSGLLLSIIRSEDELSAFSVLVPELFSSGIAVSGLFKPGTEVYITGGTVRTENIVVDSGGAELWDGSINSNAYKSEPNIVAVLEGALIKYGKRGGLLGVIDKSCESNIFERKALDVLAGALESVTSECTSGSPVLHGISGLVGLGVGFTPSGDDFISGVILGEDVVKKSLRLSGKQVKGTGNFPIVDRVSIEKALKKTSYGGRTLLWQVLRDQFPFYMVKLANSLLTEGPSEIAASVSMTVTHGETSGTDFLTGFLWYLKNCVL